MEKIDAFNSLSSTEETASLTPLDKRDTRTVNNIHQLTTNPIFTDLTKQKPTLSICLLTKESICALTLGCFMGVQSSKELEGKVHVKAEVCLGQSDLPKARSNQVSEWLKFAQKGDMFMFIDSDQTFKKEDILKSVDFLQSGKCSVICGAYTKKNGQLTVEPRNLVSFYKEKEGELWYGATGFMMFTYDIVTKIASNLTAYEAFIGQKTFPFFYQRVVEEHEVNRKDIWLGEDYSFCWLARQCGGKVMGYLSPTIGHIIPMERFPVIPQGKKWPEKSIVIYCGKNAENWSPKSLNTGIGGSETAIIKLAPYWVKAGYSVTVFCSCSAVGNYDGVEYKNYNEICFVDEFDILISWRNPDILTQVDTCCRKWYLDMHDIIDVGKINPILISRVEKICVKSEFQKRMFGGKYEDKLCVIPNGGEQLLPSKVERDPNYLIYSSSYDRGLPYMLKWGWPKIKKACPDAVLKIYYGWDLIEKLWPKTADANLYREIVRDLMKQDGVVEMGRVPQGVLLAEKSKANIHWYTGDFPEIDCISVRESASLGCIPVVSDFVEVFREKPYCTLVEGDPKTQVMQEKAADVIIDLILNKEKADKVREKMTLSLSNTETWENVANRWLKLFE